MEAGAAFGCIEEDLRRKGSQEYLEARFGSLAEELQSADMLPAIVFHDSRVGCERLALALGNHLRAKVGKYRRDEKIQSKIDALVRLLNQIPVPEGRVGKDGVLILTPEEFDDVQQRKSLATAISLLEAIPQECTVTPPGRTQLTNSELEEEFDEKRDPFNPSRPLHSLLLYGVGVHHAGLPAVYRQAVERLFRMQRLGVVVSTSTLALGINMPSKTSVFAGDSIFLSPMQFQQEAGRAGRRGFDLRGHIVFFGLPGKKVQRLLVGELPRIEGSIPMTASLTLRLLMKAQVLPQAEDSVARAVGRLATCPLFCPSPSIPFQQAHLFQFFAQHVFAEGFLGPARQAPAGQGLTKKHVHHLPSSLVELRPRVCTPLYGMCSASGDGLRWLCGAHLVGGARELRTGLTSPGARRPDGVVPGPTQEFGGSALQLLSSPTPGAMALPNASQEEAQVLRGRVACSA